MSTSMDATPEKRGWTRVWGALVDANPVLAKELLVTARTPVFVASMVVAPVLLGAFVLVARLSHDLDFGSMAGPRMFYVYIGGLMAALGIVGAALGSTVVVQEREAGALEALKFSALRPSRIVLGKFAAVMLAEAAIVLCTLPLLGYALAMGGVSLGEIRVAMAIALACGSMSASIGIAVSSNVPNTRRSLLVSLVAAGVVGMGVMIWLIAGEDLEGRFADTGMSPGRFGVVVAYLCLPVCSRHFAFLYLLPAYAFATVLWFGHAAATSGLMDASEDRSQPVKRWTLGAYAMGMAALVASAATADRDLREALGAASMIATALLAVALLFAFAGEPVRPTRRILARSRSLLSRAVFPSALAPSVLFTLMTSGAVLMAIPVLSRGPGGLEFVSVWIILTLAALGGFMATIAARRGKARARQLGAAALVALTFLFALLHDGSRPSWADVICPLLVPTESSVRAAYVMTCSVVAWGAAAAVSLLAMGFAVRSRTAVSARS